jgi:hypothetical protein
MLVGAQKPGLCCAVVTQCGLWRLRGCPRHGGYVAHQCIGRFTVAAFADATAASPPLHKLHPCYPRSSSMFRSASVSFSMAANASSTASSVLSRIVTDSMSFPSALTEVA